MAGPPHAKWRQRCGVRLAAHWYRPRPGLPVRLLWPLSGIYALLRRAAQALQQREARRQLPLGVPVIVVGNLVAGGAGKTPLTMAVVQALQRAGRAPGVVSRGYGRGGRDLVMVAGGSAAHEVGDEPLLIHRRTGAPVVVAPRRTDAARALLAARREVDVIVADDALQHRRLPRDVEIIVFDERGIGNGLLLPAGPLREPFAAVPPPGALVVYNHAEPTTPWPGRCLQRGIDHAVPLRDWHAGRGDAAVPLSVLAARPLVAMAGIAAPERFFAMLEAAGLRVERLPLPDHHGYAGAAPPWPPQAEDVVMTEKDAVKLERYAGSTAPRLWVVPLDLQLPDDFVAELLARLPPP
jgi:tetraacyldisaccharide 4'-kinase